MRPSQNELDFPCDMCSSAQVRVCPDQHGARIDFRKEVLTNTTVTQFMRMSVYC